MERSEELNQIINRIEKGQQTAEDIAVVRQRLLAGDRQLATQLGKYNVNLGEGKDIHIGDRIYRGTENDVIQRPREDKLLLDDVSKEVKGRLSKSLFIESAKPIHLKKELEPELVNCPWNLDIKSNSYFKAFSCEQSAVLDIFEHDEIAGKLLIVGEPGAGKTTTLLELTEALIIKAEKQSFEPIPVILNLASWQDKQSIREWMVGGISAKYGKSIATVKQWLNEQKLLPMLDGLDELELSIQELCIRAINIFLSQENRPLSLVVCSRRDEYINCKVRLNLNGAVCLLPLSDEQIQGYLQQIENAPSWQTIFQDSVLLKLVRIPLFLNVAIVACQKESPEKWEMMDSSEERIQHLWNSYIYERLTHEDRSEKILTWLTWIAQQLTQQSKEQESQKVGFVVSQLQPYRNLDRHQNKIFTFILCLTIVSLIELAFYLKNGLDIEQLQHSVSQINLLIILIVLGAKLADVIQPRDKFISSYQIAISSTTSGLIIGLTSMLSYNIFRLILDIYYNLTSSLFYLFFLVSTSIIITIGYVFLFLLCFMGRCSWGWLIPSILPPLFLIASALYSFLINYLFGQTEQTWYVGIISGLMFGQIVQTILIRITYKGSPILSVEKATHSNQAIRKSLINASIIGTATTLIIGLIKGFYQGISIGLIFWMLSGGIACIQHLTLRLILYWKGYIPWNYNQFLNYATERTLLQRIGGSYKFIHRLLQEYFVNTSFETRKK